MHQVYSHNNVPISSISQFQPVMGNSITNNRSGQVNVPPANMTNITPGITPGMMPNTNFMGQLPVNKALNQPFVNSGTSDMTGMTNPSFVTPPIPSRTNQEQGNVEPINSTSIELVADNQSLQRNETDVKCKEGENDEIMQEKREEDKTSQEMMDIEENPVNVEKKEDIAVDEVKQENEQNSPQSHFFRLDLGKLKEGKNGWSEESGNENVFINPEVCVVMM